MNTGVIGRFVQLRYLLLWAQARTNKGRSAVLVAGLLLALWAMLVVQNGSFALAAFGATLHRSREIAFVILSSVGLDVVVVSALLLGAGPGAAFDDAALRRYPLSTSERFTIRHLTGLLEPLWLLLLAAGVGLSFGFASARIGRLPLALAGAALYVIVVYFAAVLVVSLLRRSTRPGLAGGVVWTGALAAAPLLNLILFESRKPEWWGYVDSVLRLLPAGPAADAMTSSDLGTAAAALTALTAWATGLGALLLLIDRRPPHVRSAMATGRTPYELLRTVRIPPLVARSLLYQVRCARMRVNLLLSAPVIAAGGAFGQVLRPHGFVAFSLVFLFLGAAISTNACVLNLLGHDARGLARHVIVSGSLRPALRAASAASICLASAIIVLATVLWFIFWRVSPTLELAMLCLGAGLSGTFVVNGIGLWTSVLDPYSESFDSVRMERPFAVGNVIMFALFAVVFYGVFKLVVSGAFGVIRDYWYLAPLVTALAYGFYRLALKHAARLADRRCETLTHSLAGGVA